MKLDITINKGSAEKPAVIFIHGLGMDKRIWANPEEARMLAGRFPIRYLLAKKPGSIHLGKEKDSGTNFKKRFTIGNVEGELKTSFDDLKSLGYTVITWSQKRPAGPIDIAVSELNEIIESAKKFKKFTDSGIVLICHSRGGLIARKYLERKDKSVKGLITLATPHHGSSLARWAEFIAPLGSLISPLIRKDSRKTLSSTTKRLLDFIESKAIKELLPDSEFFRSLKDIDCSDLKCLSFGGTSPSLFTLYRWTTDKKMLRPKALFSFPDMLEKIMLKKFYPPELKKGYGDGLVSAKSSVMPGCKDHHNFKVNHAGILFDEEIRGKIIKAVERIL